MSATWRDKANRIISILCYDSWKQANFGPSGKKFKRHRPYNAPPLAAALVECLGLKDQSRAEIAAKNLFLSYEGLKVIK